MVSGGGREEVGPHASHGPRCITFVTSVCSAPHTHPRRFEDQEELASRDLDPNVAPQPACKEYIQFLTSLSSEPFPVLLAVLWAVERAYHIAWKEAAPLQPPYDIYALRWSSPQFAQYVDAMGAALDKQLDNATSSTRQGVLQRRCLVGVMQRVREIPPPIPAGWSVAMVQGSCRSCRAEGIGPGSGFLEHGLPGSGMALKAVIH